MRLPFPAPPGIAAAPVPPERLPRPCALEGPWAANAELRKATRLFQGAVVGSESVAVGPDGTLWMLDKWGYAWTAAPDAAAPGGYRLGDAPVAYLGPGRPLGFHFTPGGDALLVCDSKGLLRLELGGGAAAAAAGGGRLTVLANEAGGRPIAYANDLDVSATTGKVYFSDSTVIPPILNDAAPRPW